MQTCEHITGECQLLKELCQAAWQPTFIGQSYQPGDDQRSPGELLGDQYCAMQLGEQKYRIS